VLLMLLLLLPLLLRQRQVWPIHPLHAVALAQLVVPCGIRRRVSHDLNQ